MRWEPLAGRPLAGRPPEDLSRPDAGQQGTSPEDDTITAARLPADAGNWALLIHDLKSPLTVIRATAQMLAKQLATNKMIGGSAVDEQVELLLDASSTLAAMLDELLDVSRLEAGQPVDLYRPDTDLVDLLAAEVASQQQRTDRHRIALAAEPPHLVGRWDAPRLRRVVANLLGNAIAYSPDGGEIHVRLAIENHAGIAESWAVLEVSDSGLGIPAQDLPQIFEPFHRGSNVAGRIAGHGLGLAGARMIVEAHGGTIGIESEEGRGTTVRVRLPVGMQKEQRNTIPIQE